MESFNIDRLQIIPVEEQNTMRLRHFCGLFNIHFLFHHVTRINGNPTVTKHNRYTFQVPCDMLFQYAEYHMVQDLLPNMEIPSDILDVVLTQLVSTARAMFDVNSLRSPRSVVLTMVVKLFVSSTSADTSRFADSLEKLEADNDASCGEAKSCCICLSEFSQTQQDDGGEVKSEVVRTPCAHLFHKSCILRWFVNNPSCPMCRHRFI